MNDEIDVLCLVARRLDGAAIPYMVSGSLAMTFYAEPRMTRDVDLVVELHEADVDRFVALFSDDFYCEPAGIRRAIQRQGMFNIIHAARVVKVDIIVRKAEPYRREEFERRRRVTFVEGQELSIVTPEDLVLSKLVWAREGDSSRQLDDVRQVLAGVPALDRAYLNTWAARLGVDALLDEVERAE